VPPERHLTEAWVAQASGVPGAAIHGAHLRLPGCSEEGPTLEIFQYNLLKEGEAPAINRPGLAHLAFAVDDVPAALDAVRAAGGGQLGELVRVEVPGVGRLVFVYASDPEGNLIELQRWER
jgi:catechol 2,3-dioxygenase-like lactoylglutathione lyase family enzyme